MRRLTSEIEESSNGLSEFLFSMSIRFPKEDNLTLLQLMNEYNEQMPTQRGNAVVQAL